MEAAVEAARRGDAIYFALSADQLAAVVNSRDDDHRSLLHTAAAAGSLQTVQFLAEHGAKALVNDADEEARCCSSREHIGMIALALAGAARPQPPPPPPPPPPLPLCLQHTASYRFPFSVSGLHRQRGCSPDMPTGFAYRATVHMQGWTPLHSAASAGHESVAALLVSLGAAASATTAQQRTPLHYAASKGQAGIVALLLGAGAPADARDATGTTALHRAAATGRLGICRARACRGPFRVHGRAHVMCNLLCRLGGAPA